MYRITNTQINKHYYGVRSSKVEPKLDLGIKYFSSSRDKEFIKEQKENRYIFKYKIIKRFESREEAINLEIKLHDKFNVGKNNLFYNKVKQTSKGFCTEGTHISEEHKEKIRNHIVTDETRAKLSISMKNRRHSDETKLKMKNSATGKPKSEEHKEKIRNRIVSDETKAKLKEAKTGENNPMFGRKHKRVVCPHCDKEISINTSNLFHFDNCKSKL